MSENRPKALTWNEERDKILVEVVRSQDLEPEQILEAIMCFDAYKDRAVTLDKLRSRVNYLRRIGVKVPQIARVVYKPDVAALNLMAEEK